MTSAVIIEVQTYYDHCPKQCEFSPLHGWEYAPLVVPVQKRFPKCYAVTLVKPIGRTGGLRVISQFGRGLSPSPVLTLLPKSILGHPRVDTGYLTT